MAGQANRPTNTRQNIPANKHAHKHTKHMQTNAESNEQANVGRAGSHTRQPASKREQPSKQGNQRTDKPAFERAEANERTLECSKQISTQGHPQAIKQVGKQASEQASKQASKRASKVHEGNKKRTN